jgi:hypothetical protein
MKIESKSSARRMQEVILNHSTLLETNDVICKLRLI